jgi:GNAT superfamily N-acetyltransferase
VSDVSYRSSVPGDAEAIARVHVATWKTAYRGLLPDDLLDSMNPVDRIPRWQRTLNDAHSSVFVAEIGGEIVGFLAAAPCDEGTADGCGELDAIYILESASGQGIGRTFMTMSDQWMRAQGYTRAVLWVLPTNAGAIRFYEAHGWRDDGADKQLGVPGGLVPARRYAKTL